MLVLISKPLLLLLLLLLLLKLKLMLKAPNWCCRALLELLKRDIKPLDIMTPKAFENGITTVMALGGSTNAVLHLLAMSRAAGCPLTLEDFQRISDKTPFIADLKPSGKYLMEDLHKVCCAELAVCFLI